MCLTLQEVICDYKFFSKSIKNKGPILMISEFRILLVKRYPTILRMIINSSTSPTRTRIDPTYLGGLCIYLL